MSEIVYKIVTEDQWREALDKGVFDGAPVDLADGFIHFSTGAQVRETARRHFAGHADLLIIAFDSKALGAKLKFEPSRGGDLFPHLYAPLDPALALSVAPLPIGDDGTHRFPDGVA